MRAAALRLIARRPDAAARPDGADRDRDLRRGHRARRDAGLRAGLDDPFEDALDQTRGAHVAVYGELTDARVATLTALPGVARPRARTARVAAPLNGGGLEIGLEALPAAERRGGPPASSPRAAARPRRARSCVERSFARQTACAPGQRLTSATDGHVAGLAVTTEQASYPRWDPGIVWAADVTGPAAASASA